MKCAHIRRILAVSPREWTAAQRQQVEEHTRACAGCARLTRDFAAQERALSALPQTRMSPGRQRAVLAQTRREAGWLRLRVRLSNALTAAAGILALAFLIAAVVTLLPTPPPGSAAPPTGTPAPEHVPALPAPTPIPDVTPPSAAPAPTGPLILVDNSPRSGVEPPADYRRSDLYTLLRESNYQVRQRLERDLFPKPAFTDPPPITAKVLDGVDLLILPWVSCYASAATRDGGSVEFDFNLTPGEAGVIRDWVTGGGQALFVLDPVHNCYFEALETFGIHADVAQATAWHDDLLHAGEGNLPDGRRFALAARYRLQPLHAPEGESWARFSVRSGEHDALVVQRVGAGRVAVLGAPALVDGMRFVSRETDAGQPAPLFAADNLPFLVAVIEELTGTPSGLDVESIVWEEQVKSLHAGSDRLAERLAFWTPERVAWAVQGDDGLAQAISAQVRELQSRLDEATTALAGLDAGGAPDPERYDIIRAMLADTLSGLNRLDEQYGQAARESWEGRQARTLRPWLLGSLGTLALLAGVAAWGLRRLDVAPAQLGQTALTLAPFALAALLLLTHLLAAADMVGFGLRAGGYPLNRWGVWAYAALAALAALVFLCPGSRATDGLTRLGLPLLVALALMLAHFFTDLAGAEYATYRDYEQFVVLLPNLGVALALCLAGLLYRRPHWLAAAGGFHLALVLGVMGGSSLVYALRDGFAPWQVYRVVLLPSPLPYLLIIYALGLLAARPARQRTYWSVLFVSLGVLVTVGTILFFTLGYGWMNSSRPAFFDWLTNLMLMPLLLALGILSSVYVWRRERSALQSPLAATLLLLGLAALLSPWLLGPDGLPQSGAAMPWLGPDRQVPAGAWTVLLPIARVLTGVIPWLTLLVVALQTWQQIDRRSSVAVSAGRLPAHTRRRLLSLALGYAGLLVAAIALNVIVPLQRQVPPEMIWDSRRALVVWGLVSAASIIALTTYLCRRSGPGRWGGLGYALALTVQLPAWLLGLAQLSPVWGLFGLLALLQGLSFDWHMVTPWLSTPALVLVVWYLVIAARALRRDNGGET